MCSGPEAIAMVGIGSEEREEARVETVDFLEAWFAVVVELSDDVGFELMGSMSKFCFLREAWQLGIA